MHKINRTAYSFTGDAVQITGLKPVPEVPDIPDNAEEELSEEEKAAILERQKAEEEKKRIDDLVEQRVNEIIIAHREAVNNEANLIIQKAKAAAESITDNAAKAAAEAISSAKAEGEELKEKFRRQGYTDGFAEGKEEAEKKAQTSLDAAGQFLEEINARKEAYFISNEEELRETVISSVEKIVLEKLRKSDKVVERIVAQAAKNFRNSDYVKISVMEGNVSKTFRTDMEYVKTIAEGITDVEVELLPADEYPEGSVILDNGSEIIDASIPTQLEFLREIVNNSDKVTEEEQ